MSERSTRHNLKAQKAGLVPPSRGKAKKAAADIGNSDISSEESVKGETPIDPHTIFSAEQYRHVQDTIGISTSSLNQRFNE